MRKRSRPAMGTLFSFLGLIAMGLYFTFAAVQGDYGVFKRAEVTAEGRALSQELATLHAEVAAMENLTRRLFAGQKVNSLPQRRCLLWEGREQPKPLSANISRRTKPDREARPQ